MDKHLEAITVQVNKIDEARKYTAKGYINMELVDDIQVDGVDTRDYPDFCDAYICSASWSHTGEELTDEELEQLQGENGELVHELATESCF